MDGYRAYNANVSARNLCTLWLLSHQEADVLFIRRA